MTLKEVLNQPQPVLIDFYSSSCPPCLVLREVLVELKKMYPSPLKIVTVDQQTHADVFKAFSINHLPALLLLKNGKPIWSGKGLFSADDLVKILKEKKI